MMRANGLHLRCIVITCKNFIIGLAQICSGKKLIVKNILKKNLASNYENNINNTGVLFRYVADCG